MAHTTVGGTAQSKNRCYVGPTMTPRTASFLASGLALWSAACGSDSAESTSSQADAGADVAILDSVAPDGADAQETAPELDAAPDAPVEAGPTSCAEPCSAACASNGPIDGECTSCVDTVCEDYKARAEGAPNLDTLLTCIDECDGESSCSNDCCNKYPQACAWEVAYEMCTCGFPIDECSAECAEDCSTSGLTQNCGVCAAQTPCSLATFDYLFAEDRYSHQDCVETCAGSTMSLEECLDLCRTDHPEEAAAYDAFLACVCTQ